MNRIKRSLVDKTLKLDFKDNKPWPRYSEEDRMKLYRRCGDKCFLIVKGNAQEIIANPKKTLKFPVCRVPVRKEKCKLSPSGLLAANRRARLTKKYPELVEETKTLIQHLGTTAVSRKAMTVKAVRLGKKEGMKHTVTLVYTNGLRETLKEPLSARTIKKRYDAVLSDSQKKKLNA